MIYPMTETYRTPPFCDMPVFISNFPCLNWSLKSYIRFCDSENHPCKVLVFIFIIMCTHSGFCEAENAVSSKMVSRANIKHH